MKAGKTAPRLLLGLGIVISIAGALFAWFMYSLFAAGDCNPCGPPPLWVWSPLVVGTILLASALALRLNHDQRANSGGRPPHGEAT